MIYETHPQMIQENRLYRYREKDEANVVKC